MAAMTEVEGDAVAEAEAEVVPVSQYEGVVWYRRDSTWCAKPTIHGKVRYLGQFQSEEEAWEACQVAKKKAAGGGGGGSKNHGAHAPVSLCEDGTGCIMGYSMLTTLGGSEVRYTEWVDYNGLHTSWEPRWLTVYGVEMYNHTCDPAENHNVAGTGKGFAQTAVGGELRAILRSGWAGNHGGESSTFKPGVHDTTPHRFAMLPEKLQYKRSKDPLRKPEWKLHAREAREARHAADSDIWGRASEGGEARRYMWA